MDKKKYLCSRFLIGNRFNMTTVNGKWLRLVALIGCTSWLVSCKQAAEGVGQVQKQTRQVVERAKLVEKFVPQGDVGAVGDDAPDVLRQGFPGGVEHRGPAHGHAEEGDPGRVVAPRPLA